MVKTIFVAELIQTLDGVEVPADIFHHYVVNTNKHQTCALTLSNFKQMFYNGGGESFNIAPAPQFDLSGYLIGSVWGDVSWNKGCGNNTKYYNYNRFSGKKYAPDHELNPYSLGDPTGGNDFWTEERVLPNYECDLGIKKHRWTTASRMKVEDELNNLSFRCPGASKSWQEGYTTSWEKLTTDLKGETTANLVISLIIKNGHGDVLDNKIDFNFKVTFVANDLN